MANKVEGLMGVSVEKIHELVDANTVIGTPINVAEGITVIPVSRVSYGFASGDTDLPNKSASELFGGGAGAGIQITPVAFLTIKNGDINLLPVVSRPDSMDRMISMVPDLVDKVSDKITKKPNNQ